MHDQTFIEPTIGFENLDTFQIKDSIYQFIKSQLFDFNGDLLDIGCGKMPYKKFILENSKVANYIGLDIDTALDYDSEIKPDITWNGIQMPIESESFDIAIATEVLEHCFEPEVLLSEACRILKPQGILYFTVPFLWNLHEVPYDAYRYTPFSLEKHLNNAGFNNVKLFSTGGWHASMAQMLGLWIKRSPMSKRKRYLISWLGLRIIPYLLRMDKKNKIKFSERQMITGLCGIAKK